MKPLKCCLYFFFNKCQLYFRGHLYTWAACPSLSVWYTMPCVRKKGGEGERECCTAPKTDNQYLSINNQIKSRSMPLADGIDIYSKNVIIHYHWRSQLLSTAVTLKDLSTHSQLIVEGAGCLHLLKFVKVVTQDVRSILRY